MSNPVDPLAGAKQNKVSGSNKLPTDYQDLSKQDDLSETHKVMGMNFTKKEYLAFLNNEVKMLINGIKEQERKMHEAQQKLKKSIEGEGD